MGWEDRMDQGKPTLIIYAPDHLTDPGQDLALEACERKRPQIEEILLRHGVAEARISPYASSTNVDGADWISCTLKFQDKAQAENIDLALAVTSAIEKETGYSTLPLKADYRINAETHVGEEKLGRT